MKRGDSSAFVKDKDGKISGGPAVVLTINKQPEADTSAVTDRVLEAIEELRPILPSDLKIVPMYAQKSFIDRAIENVVEALRDGGILVVIHSLSLLDEFSHNIYHADSDTTFVGQYGNRVSLPRSINQHDDTRWTGSCYRRLVDDAIVDVENIFRRLKEN